MESVIKGRLQKLNCHFTWALEEGSITPFDPLWDQLTNRIEECRKMAPDRLQKNTMYMSGKCLQAYLHLSSLNGNSDQNKALKVLEESLKELEKIENLSSNENKAYEYILFANRAWALYRSSAISDANKVLDDIDQKYPVDDLTPEIGTHINGCKGYALSRFGSNKYDEAIQCFRQAVKVLPENGIYWGQMAILLSRQKRQEKSKDIGKSVLEAFDQSIRFNNSDGIVLAEYGRFLVTCRKHKKAGEMFRNAEEMDPESSRVLQFIGEHYSKKYKHEKVDENVKDIFSQKAIGYFQRALKIGRTTFILHKLGKVYEDTGQIEEALKHYDEALAVRPTKASAKFDKAKVLVKLNRKDEAQQLLAQSINDAPNKVDASGARLEMARFLIKECKFEDGYHQIRESIKLHPKGFYQMKAARQYIDYLTNELDKHHGENTVDTLCSLGWVYCILGEFEVARADAYYIRAYKYENLSDTQKVRIASDLLEIYLKHKMLKDARFWLKKADRKDLEILYYKSVALWSAAKRDHFQECIELSEAVKLLSIEAAENLMNILVRHNENIRLEKYWWVFYRFCGRVSILCDTDSKKIVENGETVSQAQKSSIEERKNRIRPEGKNIISELFPNSWKCLISFYKKCISLAKEDLLHQEAEDKSSSILLQTAISELLVEARSLLDKIMAKFQEIHYPDLTFCSKFMFIPGENVKKDLRIHLEKKQGWKEFSGKFLNLFEYLVKIQPGNEVNHWLRLLFAIRNEIQHQKDASDIKLPEHKIKVTIRDEDHYISVNPIDLAVKSGEEVEKIVKNFETEMIQDITSI